MFVLYNVTYIKSLVYFWPDDGYGYRICKLKIKIYKLSIQKIGQKVTRLKVSRFLNRQLYNNRINIIKNTKEYMTPIKEDYKGTYMLFRA